MHGVPFALLFASSLLTPFQECRMTNDIHANAAYGADAAVPPPNAALAAAAWIGDAALLRTAAQRDPIAFWRACARHITWQTPFDEVLDATNAPFFRWFVGGTTNVVTNAIDRQLATRANHPALIWEGEDGTIRQFTYQALADAVNRCANMLKALGVGRGDRVAIYMPRIPEQAIAMYAVSKIGAVHTVVYGGLSVEALHVRIVDAQAKLVITADAGWIVGDAIVLHGPMMHGCTTVMHEGAPTTPDPGRWWSIVERHKVSIFYTAPTGVRGPMRWGDDWPARYDLSSLRLLSIAGEPLNPAAWHWYYEQIGQRRCRSSTRGGKPKRAAQ